jgi:hypothetical protein
LINNQSLWLISNSNQEKLLLQQHTSHLPTAFLLTCVPAATALPAAALHPCGTSCTLRLIHALLQQHTRHLQALAYPHVSLSRMHCCLMNIYRTHCSQQEQPRNAAAAAAHKPPPTGFLLTCVPLTYALLHHDHLTVTVFD